MRVWATGEQQQVLLVSQIESLLLSRLNVSSVHPFPLSSVVDAMSVSPARPAPSVPHALSPAAVALTRVSKSTSAPHSQSKMDSLLSSLPPCSLSSTSSPGSGTLSLSLSLSLPLVLLLARSLFPGHNRRSVLRLQLTVALQSCRGACSVYPFSVFLLQLPTLSLRR